MRREKKKSPGKKKLRYRESYHPCSLSVREAIIDEESEREVCILSGVGYTPVQTILSPSPSSPFTLSLVTNLNQHSWHNLLFLLLVFPHLHLAILYHILLATEKPPQLRSGLPDVEYVEPNRLVVIPSGP